MVRKIKIKQQLARLHSQSQSSGYHWTRCIGFLIAQYTIWQHKLFFLTSRKYCWYIKFVRTTKHLNICCLQIISYMFGLEIVFIRNIKNCVCDVVWRLIGLSFFCVFIFVSYQKQEPSDLLRLITITLSAWCVLRQVMFLWQECIFVYHYIICSSLCGASNTDDELL